MNSDPTTATTPDITNRLPSTSEIMPGSKIAVSRKWLDGGICFFEVVHPQFAKALWLSVKWFAEHEGVTYLLAGEVDRTIDPPYLRRFLVKHVDFDTIAILGDDEFSRVLPAVSQNAAAANSLDALAWRRQYCENVTRCFNLI